VAGGHLGRRHGLLFQRLAEFAADVTEFLGWKVEPRTVRKSKLLNE
jgi:hypothetical protein